MSIENTTQVELAALISGLRGQAINVEKEGWINAARHMRNAADLIEEEFVRPDEHDGQPDEQQEWQDFDKDC